MDTATSRAANMSKDLPPKWADKDIAASGVTDNYRNTQCGWAGVDTAAQSIAELQWRPAIRLGKPGCGSIRLCKFSRELAIGAGTH